MTALQTDVRAAARYWWVFLLTGVAWLIVALVVLRFNEKSITTVGVIMGVVFLVAAFNEIVIWRLTRHLGFLHVLMALILGLGAIWAFTNPKETFWALASVLGFILIFSGTLHLMAGILSKATNDLWWLGVASGIFELLLGFWASQQLAPARAALIIFYVGFAAFFRGISEIVLAFAIKSGND